jgi:hypothetical protein
MPLDVRLPISGLFLAVGLLLVGYGMFGEGLAEPAGRLNSVWGGLMVIFSLILGYYGVRAERRLRGAAAELSEAEEPV